MIKSSSTGKNSTEFLAERGLADPYIHIVDEIDDVEASLRVVWLALQNKEWLDDASLGHCSDCLNRAANALSVPRSIAHQQAKDIIDRAEQNAVRAS